MTDRTPQHDTLDDVVDHGEPVLPPKSLLDPLIIGVLAAIVSLGGAGRPSFWYDEAATISASYSRSLLSCGRCWATSTSLRACTTCSCTAGSSLPSHGVLVPRAERSCHWRRRGGRGGAGQTIRVSRRRGGLRSHLRDLAAVTWAGVEARPYALSMMAAVWLTVLLVYATRRENRWAWLFYGIVLAISILLDMYLALLFFAHVAFIWVFRRSPTVRIRFAITSAVAYCVVTPFVVAAAGQAHQISWIAPIGRRTIEDVTVQQYFERSPAFALLSALVVAAAIVLWLRTSAQLTDTGRQLLTLAVAWLLIPTALIVIWSAFVHPIYTPRYLAFTAPAIALILGICIAAVASRAVGSRSSHRPVRLAAAPNYVLAQRNPYAKYGMDYSQVADLITAKAAPGDCLLVNDTVTFMPAPMRPLMAARPDAYRKLVDLTLWQRATDRNDVFDTNLIPEVVATPLSRCGVVWIITQADTSVPAQQQGPALPPGPLYGATPAFAVPHDLGFRLVQRWQFNLVQVIEAVGDRYQTRM